MEHFLAQQRDREIGHQTSDVTGAYGVGDLMDFDAFFSMDEWLLGWDFHGITQGKT